MPESLHHVVIDAHDLSGLARCWSQVLDWPILSDRERRRRRRGVACTALPVPGARDGTRTPGGFTDVRQPAVVEDASAVEVETSEPGTDDPGVVVAAPATVVVVAPVAACCDCAQASAMRQ